MSASIDLDLLKTFGQIAAPAGLAIGAFLYLGRDIVARNIFPRLTKQHGYYVVITLAFMAWTVALAGIGSWTYVSTRTPTLAIVKCEPPSQASQDSTTMTFVNRRPRPVQLFWIDPSGAAVAYSTILPGEQFVQNTFVNHSWCVKDRDTGTPVAFAVGTFTPQVVDVR